MKRIIVDYSKLTSEILNLLVEKYPDGYNHRDIISFKNAKGDNIKAVEVKTDDTIFLVKISLKLEETMEEYDVEEDNFDEAYDDDFEVEINDNDLD